MPRPRVCSYKTSNVRRYDRPDNTPLQLRNSSCCSCCCGWGSCYIASSVLCTSRRIGCCVLVTLALRFSRVEDTESTKETLVPSGGDRDVRGSLGWVTGCRNLLTRKGFCGRVSLSLILFRGRISNTISFIQVVNNYFLTHRIWIFSLYKTINLFVNASRG